jgi:hypothetical protein
MNLRMLREVKVSWYSDNYISNAGFEEGDNYWSIGDPANSNYGTADIITDGGGYDGTSNYLRLRGSSIESYDDYYAYALKNLDSESSLANNKLILSFAMSSNAINNKFKYTINGDDHEIEFTRADVHTAWKRYTFIMDLSGISPIVTLRLYVYAPSRDANGNADDNDTSVRHYAKFDDFRLFKFNSKYLDMDTVIAYPSLQMQAEDGLFNFKADNTSLKLLNNSGEATYFDNQDLFDEDTVFGFQLKYNIAGEDLYQMMFLDTVEWYKDYKNNNIDASLLEITGVSKDREWYVGKYIYSQEAGSSVRRFDLLNPTAICSDVGDINILDILVNDIRSLCAEFKIPIMPDQITSEFASNFVSDEGLGNRIAGIDGEEQGHKIILDYFFDKYSDRYYLITAPNNISWLAWQDHPDNDKLSTVEITVYEIRNGSSLTYVDSFNLDNDLDNHLQIGFIHEWEVNETSNNSNVIVYQYYSISAGGVDAHKMRFHNYKYDEVTGNLLSNGDNTVTDYYYAHSRKRAYVRNTGNIQYPTLLSFPDNFRFIYDYPAMEDYYDISLVAGTGYLIYGQTLISDNYDPYDAEREMAYATSIYYNTYFFPHYLQFGLQDPILSDVLKELCIVQDATFVIRYTDGGMNLYLRRRDSIDIPTEVDNTGSTNVCGATTKYKLNVTFEDMNTIIYQNDLARKEILKIVYDQRYSNDKRARKINMFDHIFYEIFGEITLTSEPEKVFLIKGLDFSESVSKNSVKKRTEIDVLQVSS